MRKFTPKPNAVANAVKAANDESRLDAQIREAALVMPIKDAMRQLADQARENVEQQLHAAIERYLSEVVTDPKQIDGHLTHATVEGDAGTVYQMDGTPVLFVGALNIERDGTSMQAQQEVKCLLPADFKPASRIIMPY
jgi:hypothetical protein